MDFPDLKMIVAHLGHPWEEDLVVLIRKCPNVYTDISAVHYRPWRYWQAMVTAMEYGVDPQDPARVRLSRRPRSTTSSTACAMSTSRSRARGCRRFPTEIQDRIIYENWKAFFPQWA